MSEAPRKLTLVLVAMTLANAMQGYVLIARGAAQHGYTMTFLAVAVIGLVDAALVAWLVRRPPASGSVA